MTKFQVCQNRFETASLNMWTMVTHKIGRIQRLFGLITAKFENEIHHKTPRFIMETSMDKSHISSFWSYKMTKSLRKCDTFADAIVHPLLKKPSLDLDDLSNYRPISTFNFVSKILERIVMNRMQTHLSSNSLLSPFQSAYRRFHSTESALLTVHNDIICSMDGGKVTALVLLDLSAAFDTVDHSILLHRLKNWFGISGPALNWFSTYLSPRTQSVYLNGNYSSSALLTCGVPQGSVLGPLLFTLYTTPLGTLLNNHSLGYHFYADDTQIYISFDSLSCDSSVQLLSAVFDEVQSWMASNKLLLNPSKTEFLLLGTPQQLKKFD